MFNRKLPKLSRIASPNATLKFKRYTGTTTIDPSTNNVTPVFETITVEAVLTEMGDKVKEENLAGTNLLDKAVRGYLMEPLPEGVDASDRIDCEIETGSGKEIGVLHITERVTPFIKKISADIGIPIQGTFTTNFGG